MLIPVYARGYKSFQFFVVNMITSIKRKGNHPAEFLLTFLLHRRRILLQKFHNRVIMRRIMGIAASGTVLHQLPFLILKIYRPAQTVLQAVHRAVTKQTVKILPFHILMTREIFTCRITEKTIAVFHMTHISSIYDFISLSLYQIVYL